MATQTFQTVSGPLGHRTFGLAAPMGVDTDGGKYAVICEAHHTVVTVQTGRQARDTATTEFCDACKDVS